MRELQECTESCQGKRILLLDNEHIRLEVEYYNEPKLVFLHMMEVKSFTRETLRYLKGTAEDLVQWLVPLYGSVHTYAKTDRQDLRRLAKHLSFDEVATNDDWTIYRRT